MIHVFAQEFIDLEMDAYRNNVIRVSSKPGVAALQKGPLSHEIRVAPFPSCRVSSAKFHRHTACDGLQHGKACSRLRAGQNLTSLRLFARCRCGCC